MEIIWQEMKRQDVSGQECKIGRWVVGGWLYDGRRTQESKPFMAICKLPGIRVELGHFDTEARAQAKVESAVRHWVAQAGIA